MGCVDCGRGFHTECKKCRKGKCHPVADESAKQVLTGQVGRPLKNPQDITDPHSTGRKRAAHLYPLFEDKSCEWQRKKRCGGGLKPITGCIKGLQQARHHGPVKNTLRNEPGNVHRICDACHNRWHALNNPIYVEDAYATLPHNPEEELATEAELLDNEAWWIMNKEFRNILKKKVVD